MQPTNPIPHLSAGTHFHRRRVQRKVEGAGTFRGELQRAAAGMMGRENRYGRMRTGAHGLRRLDRGKGSVFLSVNHAAGETREPVGRPGGAVKSGRGTGDAGDAIRDALRTRIHGVAERLGVDPVLSEAVARAESGLDQSARSPDGASEGAFQMKAPTATAMRERLNGNRPGMTGADEVVLGVGYLRYLDRLFARRAVLDSDGHTTIPVPDPAKRQPFAIAAYNAGEGTVATAQRRARAAGLDPRKFEDVAPFLPAVTRRYVGRVLTFAAAAGGAGSAVER